MKRKGISPLIAAVLLIAFTMAVAAILTAWVTTFTGKQTSAVGNQSEELIQCSYASLSISDAVYDSTSSKIDVSINNRGTVDFNNVSVHVFRNGQWNGTAYTGALDTAGVSTVTIENVFKTPTKVKAISKNCPSKSDQVTGSEISTS